MKENVRERLLAVMCAVISIGAFLLLWWWGTHYTDLRKLMPDPASVLEATWGYIVGTVGKCSLIMHLFSSLRRVLIGFLIGSALGVSLGLLMGRYPVIRAIFNPIYRFIRPIPPIAWIPISIIWFGLGEQSLFRQVFRQFLQVFRLAFHAAGQVLLRQK